MFKKALTKGLTKLDPAVKQGARQAAQGKPGLLTDVFTMKGRDTKATKKRP